MSSPPPYLAPFPAQSFRSKFTPDDWAACTQAWTLFLTRRLLLSDKQFASSISSDVSLAPFLTSYCRESCQTNTSANQPGNSQNKNSIPADAELHNLVFRLSIRTLQLPTPSTPPSLLSFTFLSDFAACFGCGAVVRELLDDIWRRHNLDDSADLTQPARNLIQSSASKTPSPPPPPSTLETTLRRMGLLTRACPGYGRHLLAGSELLDALVALWERGAADLRRKIIELTFLAMRSLVSEPRPNPTALLDQLYDLKAAAEGARAGGGGGSPTRFLGELVSTTAILNVLRLRLKDSTRARAQPVIAYLQMLDDGTMARRRHVRKGKRVQKDNAFGHGAVGEVHMHKMASVSQIQELFPDLGVGFVVKLLEHYQDDVEQVTAALLEDNLPPHLAVADRAEPLLDEPPASSMHAELAPRSTPPLESQRRNIYDNDDFDQLAISTRNLHIGKREEKMKLQPAGDKAEIYSALATFDSDDDERDDTYDGEDVGGTVDVQGYDKDAEDAVLDQNSEALFRAWKMNSAMFERDATTRKSAARQALRSETNMTDEAIEGFAVMLRREPRRLRALEAKHLDFTGEQRELHSTKWRQEEGADGAEGEGSGARGRGGMRAGGRGGRGRGRGRGNVAGPADDRDTQIARQRKDEHKAQRANHNRRAQRAKKVARAGFPG